MKKIRKIISIMCCILFISSNLVTMSVFTASAHSYLAPTSSSSAITGLTGKRIIDDAIKYYEEHTKNKRKSTHDKHTKSRPGRDTEKKKQKSNWKPRCM